MTLPKNLKSSPSLAIAYMHRGSANSDPNRVVVMPQSAPKPTMYFSQGNWWLSNAAGSAAVGSIILEIKNKLINNIWEENKFFFTWRGPSRWARSRPTRSRLLQQPWKLLWRWGWKRLDCGLLRRMLRSSRSRQKRRNRSLRPPTLRPFRMAKNLRRIFHSNYFRCVFGKGVGGVENLIIGNGWNF